MTNNIEKFNETVSILVKAYMNDELRHQDCQACVVGNLCGGNWLWRFLFMTCESGIQAPTTINSIWLRTIGFESVDELLSAANNVCLSTGYTVEQLAKIEFAFESTPRVEDEDEWMFNGLMAVVSVLAEIHGVSLDVSEDARKLFVKA